MQGNVTADGQVRSLRFGSANWASEGLPPSTAEALQQAADMHAQDSVVSVLVDSLHSETSTAQSSQASSSSSNGVGLNGSGRGLHSTSSNGHLQHQGRGTQEGTSWAATPATASNNSSNSNRSSSSSTDNGTSSSRRDSSSSGNSNITSGQADSFPSSQGPRLYLFTFQDTVDSRSAAAVAALQQGSWRRPEHRRLPSKALSNPLHKTLTASSAGQRPSRDALHVMMLTGDTAASAERYAEQLGIADVRAGLTPEQKLQVRHAQYDKAQPPSQSHAHGAL